MSVGGEWVQRGHEEDVLAVRVLQHVAFITYSGEKPMPLRLRVLSSFTRSRCFEEDGVVDKSLILLNSLQSIIGEIEWLRGERKR